MKLGIVGHAEDKFTPETKRHAEDAIYDAIAWHEPEVIVSGRCPMGGVDIYAEEIAKRLEIPTIIHAPKIHQWDGPGGFKERNEAIARDADLVLCIVVKEFPAGYKGRRFPYCYHCKGRNPGHIKSGGCWTAWRADAREWVII